MSHFFFVHSRVKAVFMQELQFVLAGRVKLKTALFPMQCYALRESDTFMVNFNFNPNDYKHQLSPSKCSKLID